MAPTSNAAAPPRRQSCNRCHGQKLRCTRANNSGTGACNRCLRQGAQCLYSSSLPKGRPSMYRLAEASPANSNSPPMHSMPITAVSLGTQQQLPTDSLPATSFNATNTNLNTNANTDRDGIDYTRINANSNVNNSSSTNENTRIDVNDDTIKFVPLDASAWPWQAPLNWCDMLIDGRDRDPNLHGIVDHQTDPGAVFSSDFPNFAGSESSRNSDSDSIVRARPMSPACRDNEYIHYPGNDASDMDGNTNINIGSNVPEFGIVQLSQLSTRLYPLYRSCCILAEVAESSCQTRDRYNIRQNPLIDDTTFKSVAAWLINVPTNMSFVFPGNLRNPSIETTMAGDNLHDAFSASHHLLEIVRCLQVNAGSGPLYNTSTASNSAPASTEGGENGDFWESTTPQSLTSAPIGEPSYFEVNNGSSNYIRPPSQCHNTVVRHLVIACHTLLLNIHVTVLIVLQHDADLRNYYSPSKNVEADLYMAATALADIKLVMVLRLCSHLITRQQQAVDSYLSAQPPPPPSQENNPPISHQSILDASAAANRVAASDLEMEIQQRLDRLRQTLYI